MQNTLVKLDNYSLLAVEGTDNKKFLQGQVSCNMDLVNAGQSLPGAICNLKGRVIADFQVFQYHHVCYLCLSQGMAATVKQGLDKYIVFSKAKAFECEEKFTRLGITGPEANAILLTIAEHVPEQTNEIQVLDNGFILRCAGRYPRFEVWLDNSYRKENEKLIQALQSSTKAEDHQRWELEDIHAGIAHVTSSVSEEFLPEALNYDICGVIDFKKGCYTGQEIVARMYYRSVAKKRLYHLYRKQFSGPVSMISVASDQNAAESPPLSWQLSDDNGCHLLVILSVEVVDSGAIFILNNDAKLTLQFAELPYGESKATPS